MATVAILAILVVIVHHILDNEATVFIEELASLFQNTYLDTFLAFLPHCKNVWVTSTMFWSSQLHACCVCDTNFKEMLHIRTKA